MTKVHLRIAKGIITKAINIESLSVPFRMPILNDSMSNVGIMDMRNMQTLLNGPNKVTCLVFKWDGKSKSGTLPLLDLVSIDYV